MKRYRWIAIVLLMVLLVTGCAKASPATQQVTVTVARPTATTGNVTATTVTDATTGTVNTTDTTATTGTEGTAASSVTDTSYSAATTVSGTSTTTTTTTGANTTSTTMKATTVKTTDVTVTRPATNTGEVRAAWVSYIELAALLQTCDTPAEARAALDAMMAKMVSYNLNTVFFHVRANSDAYYASKLFKPAVAAEALLNAGFDPLAYAVEAAHKRGLELHAWVNPYRVGKQTAYLVGDTPTLTDAAGRYYYVPTSVAAQQLILDGVREILNNYAVDGIQYDDYFYPEALLEEGTVYGFESADYEAYRQTGGALSVGDWRRAGVDMLIAGTHTLTAQKGVVFGVSPAASADNTYASLYADCRKWLSQPGYVDYLCPQLYTGFEHASSPFNELVDTWMSYPRHSSVKLYVGLALYKIGLPSDTYAGSGRAEWAGNDDVMQRSVLYLREKKIPGICLYSYSYFEPGASADADAAVAEAEIRNLLTIL